MNENTEHNLLNNNLRTWVIAVRALNQIITYSHKSFKDSANLP